MKMSKRSKIMELLEKITDIEKDCSVCYKQEIYKQEFRNWKQHENG